MPNRCSQEFFITNISKKVLVFQRFLKILAFFFAFMVGVYDFLVAHFLKT